MTNRCLRPERRHAKSERGSVAEVTEPRRASSDVYFDAGGTHPANNCSRLRAVDRAGPELTRQCVPARVPTIRTFVETSTREGFDGHGDAHAQRGNWRWSRRQQTRPARGFCNVRSRKEKKKKRNNTSQYAHPQPIIPHGSCPSFLRVVHLRRWRRFLRRTRECCNELFLRGTASRPRTTQTSRNAPRVQ